MKVNFYVYECGDESSGPNRFMPMAEIEGKEIWFDMSCTDKRTAERNLEFGKACFKEGINVMKKIVNGVKNEIVH